MEYLLGFSYSSGPASEHFDLSSLNLPGATVNWTHALLQYSLLANFAGMRGLYGERGADGPTVKLSGDSNGRDAIYYCHVEYFIAGVDTIIDGESGRLVITLNNQVSGKFKVSVVCNTGQSRSEVTSDGASEYYQQKYGFKWEEGQTGLVNAYTEATAKFIIQKMFSSALPGIGPLIEIGDATIGVGMDFANNVAQNSRFLTDVELLLDASSFNSLCSDFGMAVVYTTREGDMPSACILVPTDDTVAFIDCINDAIAAGEVVVNGEVVTKQFTLAEFVNNPKELMDIWAGMGNDSRSDIKRRVFKKRKE